jgi:hypothetical protein
LAPHQVCRIVLVIRRSMKNGVPPAVIGLMAASAGFADTPLEKRPARSEWMVAHPYRALARGCLVESILRVARNPTVTGSGGGPTISTDSVICNQFLDCSTLGFHAIGTRGYSIPRRDRRISTTHRRVRGAAPRCEGPTVYLGRRQRRKARVRERCGRVRQRNGRLHHYRSRNHRL